MSTLKKLRNVFRRFGRALKPYRRNSWLMALIIIAVGGTQLLLLGKPTVGVYANAVTFILLIGAALWRDEYRPLSVSVAILPVANMIALSLPQTTVFAQTAVFYSAILLLGFVYRFTFTLDYPVENTRLSGRNYLLAVPLMIVIGEAMGVIGYGILRHHYTFGNTPLPLVAAAAVVFAVAEEALFRGLIQQSASLIMKPVLAAILSTVLFTAMSIDSTTILSPLFGLLLGAVLAGTYYIKQSVVLTIALNATAKLVYVGLMASFIFR